jgi:hypothetical protein
MDQGGKIAVVEFMDLAKFFGLSTKKAFVGHRVIGAVLG